MVQNVFYWTAEKVIFRNKQSTDRMKLLIKILGPLKIITAIVLFSIDWIVLINYILQGLDDVLQVFGFFLAFAMILFYSLFLGYSGYENAMGKKVLASAIRWLGIFFGFAVGMFLFFYAGTIGGKMFTQLFSLFSVIDIIGLAIKRKTIVGGN